MLCVYIGWTGSLLVSLGFILHTITGMSANTAIIIGTIIVFIYTMAGGMWAVSLTDFFQIIIVIIGLAVILPIVISKVGGFSTLVSSLPEDSFRMTPKEGGTIEWLNYIRAWMVIGLGTVPYTLPRPQGPRVALVCHLLLEKKKCFASDKSSMYSRNDNK